MTPSELLRNIQGMQDRANNPAPVLKAIGDLMVASADRNFEAEGRPAWKPVKPATAKRKAEAGHSKILMWSGNLARSITFKVKGQGVVMGSNLRYARIHNEGGSIHRPAHEQRLRFRLDARGNYLSQQNLQIGPLRMRNAGASLVFASNKHKRAAAHVFTVGAYDIPMPARPFLTFQPGEAESYGGMVMKFVVTGQIGGQP
jgi:phage gpG-like protein